jgi:hypothetical protein
MTGMGGTARGQLTTLEDYFWSGLGPIAIYYTRSKSAACSPKRSHGSEGLPRAPHAWRRIEATLQEEILWAVNKQSTVWSGVEYASNMQGMGGSFWSATRETGYDQRHNWPCLAQAGCLEQSQGRAGVPTVALHPTTWTGQSIPLRQRRRARKYVDCLGAGLLHVGAEEIRIELKIDPSGNLRRCGQLYVAILRRADGRTRAAGAVPKRECSIELDLEDRMALPAVSQVPAASGTRDGVWEGLVLRPKIQGRAESHHAWRVGVTGCCEPICESIWEGAWRTRSNAKRAGLAGGVGDDQDERGDGPD